MEPAVINRLNPQLMGLMGGECADCQEQWLGRRNICGHCGGRSLRNRAFSPHGKLLSVTLLHSLPSHANCIAPFYQGLVQLADGPILLAQLTDTVGCEPRVGQYGELVTRRISVEADTSLIAYGYKFRVNR